MSPGYLVVSFLLPNAQTNTAQTYYPPCQPGRLPSSKISMDILAPVPKTSSNPVPQLIKSATARTPLLPANLTILPESILRLLRRMSLTSTSFPPLFLLHRLPPLLPYLPSSPSLILPLMFLSSRDS